MPASPERPRRERPLREDELYRPAYLETAFALMDDAELRYRATHPLLPYSAIVAREELARRTGDATWAPWLP